MEGFLQALDEFRLTSPEQRRHYESTPYTEEEGAAVVRRLLDEGQKFDALIVHGDWATLGAVTELREHGLEVPRDVALLMYDDYYAVDRCTCAAESVAAAAAAHKLIARIFHCPHDRQIIGDGVFFAEKVDVNRVFFHFKAYTWQYGIESEFFQSFTGRDSFLWSTI